MYKNNLKWFLLIILSLIWGSSFILIKKGLIALNPFEVGSIRIISAAIFLLSIGFQTLFKVNKLQWKYLALTALFGTFIPAFLFAIAQTQIDSSVSSILNSLTPLNTLILGVLAFNLTFNRNQIIGILIGFFGSFLLIFNGAINHPEQNYSFAILVIIASICYAINVNLIKKYLSDLSPLTISTGNFTIMLLPAITILSLTNFVQSIQFNIVQTSVFYIMLLGVLGTGIANIIFFRLIQISTPIFATSVTYLIPIVAFLWGLQDNENLSPVQFLGAFIILIGVYWSNKKSV